MRNRRNTRKRNVVISTITNRNFIIIVSVLLVLILISFGIIKIRNYLDERTMARQAEELAKQTGISYSTIKKINSGALHYDEDEMYPIRSKNSGMQRAERVQQMLLNGSSNQEIIAETGVSEPTIRRINKGETYYNSQLTYPLRSL